MSAPVRWALLIVAAGAGTRLKAGRPKALVELADGRTILEHCLRGALGAATGGLVGTAVVVPRDPESARPLEQVCARVAEDLDRRIVTVAGGAERSDSVSAGLSACVELAEQLPDPVTHVLVHDAARPFVPPAVFRRVEDALGAGAAAVVPGIAVTDTIKTVAAMTDSPHPTSGDQPPAPLQVVDTPARLALCAVQTPQGFDLQQLIAAHRLARTAGGDPAALTDDSMLMEAAGHLVAVVDGDVESFKITTALDLHLAAALLQYRGLTSATAPTLEGTHP